MTPDSPQTEAGKRLLAAWRAGSLAVRPVDSEAILAIEQEARAAFAARIAGWDWLSIFDRAGGGDGNGTHGQDRFGFNARVSAAVLHAIEEASK